VRDEASASWLPELSAGIDWTITDQPSMAFGMLLDQHAIDFGSGFDATPGSTENWRKDVRLEWALFAPGRSAASDAAGEGEIAAELADQAVERRLVNAGIQGWVGLRAARALEDVAREAVAVVERRLVQTRTRHAEGAALRSDVLRLEVSLSAAKQDVVRAGQVVRETQSSVNVLMGRDADAPLAADVEEIVLGLGLPEGLDALTTLAGDQRAELRSAAHRVRMLTFQSEAARALHLPFLQAFARYGWDGEDPGSDTDLDSYAAGLSLRSEGGSFEVICRRTCCELAPANGGRNASSS
jgi:outer membrane protein TolC